MSDKRYSIIVPHYNSLDTLEVLLRSIPARRDIEVIVVDDHSDESPDLLCKGFEHVSCFQNLSQNKGAGAARNAGMRYATGTYVLFADADDYFLPEAFTVFDEYATVENYDLVYFAPTSMSLGGGLSVRHKSYAMLVSDYCDKNDQSIRYRFYVPWSKLIRRQHILTHDITFDEVIASNDVNFSLKVGFFASKIHADKRNVYCVVEGQATLTKIKTEQVIDSRFDALCRYNDFLQAHKAHNFQLAMAGHLKESFRFGIGKCLRRLYFCRRKGYPICYDLKHVFRALRKVPLLFQSRYGKCKAHK